MMTSIQTFSGGAPEFTAAITVDRDSAVRSGFSSAKTAEMWGKFMTKKISKYQSKKQELFGISRGWTLDETARLIEFVKEDS